MTNRALGRAGKTECVRVSVVSANLASYGYSLVEKSLAAFAIFRGPYQESPEAHYMLSAGMTLYHLLFEVERPMEPSIQSSRTSYPSHAISQLRLPSLVASIRQASSASAENAPCDTVPFWRLCPSPTRVRHLC